MKFPSSFFLGLLTCQVEAFVPSFAVPKNRRHHPIGVGGGLGWDNAGFLNSLSGSDKDREAANERYFQMSRYDGRPDKDDEMVDDNDDDDDFSKDLPGAELTSDMVQKIKESHTEEEEASGGGKMFRELLARAKQGANIPRSQANQFNQPFMGLQQQQQQPMDPYNMSVEDQARMFREMMQQQQNMMMMGMGMQQQQSPVNRGNYLQKGIDAAGRRIGRNRDADAIVNSADVYFAQLKRDSTMRNIARMQGDDDKANAVFADPSIHNIKVQVNPYLEEQRQKEKTLLETAADEMILPSMFQDNDKPKKPKSYSGISYKEQLKQMKNLKNGNTSSSTSSSTSNAASATKEEKQASSSSSSQPSSSTVVAKQDKAPKTSSTPAAAPAPAAASAPPVQETKKKVPSVVIQQQTWAQKLSIEEEQQVIVQPRTRRAPAPAATAPAPAVPQSSPNSAPSSSSASSSASASASSETTTEDDTRREIRTLMGLLLKHRGGPGFGAGRLQGPEAERLERLAMDVTSFLQQEAKEYPQEQFSTLLKPQDLQVKSRPTTAPATKTPQQPKREPVPGQRQAYNAASTYQPTSTMTAKMTQQLQELSGAMERQPNRPQGDRINSLLSCIEGAIQMYRNAPPELEEGVLITLRAALLSAVNSCNAIIAENEVKNLEAYRSVAMDPRTRTRAPQLQQQPANFYDVIPEMNKEEAAGKEPQTTAKAATATSAPMYSKDANAVFYEEVLQKLRAAAGNGKMGLREDLSTEEASELADAIAQMRSMLVQELEQGIPSASSL